MPELINNPILSEVKKAIDMWLSKDYEVKDLYSHILQIIRENSDDALKHKNQMERLLFRVQEFREVHRLVVNGHSQKRPELNRLATELDKKVHTLTTIGGYDIQRFKKSIGVQNSIFSK